MAKEDYLTADEASRAKAAGLGLEAGTKYSDVREPYFFDYVEQELIDRYGVNTVRQGGLQVHTTIDPELQEVAEAGDPRPPRVRGRERARLHRYRDR